MLSFEIIDDLDSAQSLAPDWDELAVSQGLPLCAPGWMLAWWRHLAPGDSRLRIVVVRDGARLLALAPWFIDSSERGRADLRLLGAELSDRVDILCRAGHEDEVRDELLRAILEMRPRPDLVSFEAVPASSKWERRLAGGLGGRLRFARYRNSVRSTPVTYLNGGPPEDWLVGRSSHFRAQMRKLRRKLEARNGAVRHVSDDAGVQSALRAMLALHAERWEGRGESGLTKPGVAEMLSEAAIALGPDRLRLWMAEVDGEPISVQLLLAAGGELKAWNGGWSQEHSKLQPPMLTTLAALEDAIARGQSRIDLGAGEHAYKLRFADDRDALVWGGLIVRNRRWPLTRAELAPRILRYRAKQVVEALPSSLAGRIEALVASRRAPSGAAARDR
jgi:CelD/BcsL family acetyltransferase involved in cellulose biosynthesis